MDLLLQLLEVDKFEGKSKEIDFAKGSHKLPMSLREGYKQYKRRKAWLQM